jgi:hypothetical protein
MGRVWAGLCVVCLFAAPLRASEAVPHVRGTGKFARAVVASAIRASLTIADLVQRLERSDVFVYVEVAPIEVRTAKTILLAAPGPFRYLLVSIHIDQPPDQQIVLLGHELQHALEIAEAPGVRDDAALAALYRRIGWMAGGANKFETHLAQATGARVRRDLVARMRAR